MKKNVTLKELTLINFKGIKNRTITFGKTTEIRGANATGKTTIFDAFTWCLFGKNSQDKKVFTVKTVGKDGEPIHRLQHEVTATLDINGNLQSFTRLLKENWVTPRGRAEAELQGHTTQYFIDGQETKAKKYADEVAEIIDEQLFKLITNPAYFPSLDWETQRDILLTVAGNVTHEDVAKGNETFQAILKEMGGKDLAEFKEMLAFKIKSIKEELEKCPIEVNAIHSVTPEAPDFKALEAESKKIDTKIESIDKALADAAEAARQQYEKQREQQQRIYSLQDERDQIIRELKLAHDQQENEKKAEKQKLIEEKKRLEQDIINEKRYSQSQLKSTESSIEQLKETIAEKELQIVALREEWKSENEKEYSESSEGLICPLYKIACKDSTATAKFAEGVGKEREAFNIAIGEKLDRINKRGLQLAKEKQEKKKLLDELIERLVKEQKQADEKRESLEKAYLFLESKIENTPEPEETKLDTSSNKQVIEISANIEAIQQRMEEPREDTNRRQLTDEKRELEIRRREIDKQLNIREVIENNKKKVQAILAREKELAQQKADLDGKEYNAEQLQKTLMEEVERRVNSLFKLVKFKMYEQQLNGGKKPTCIAMLDGVNYSDLNSAGKINAGLDIINTLCIFHQVTAPIFVDNAESINDILPTQSQIIKLVVTGDPELQINNQ